MRGKHIDPQKCVSCGKPETFEVASFVKGVQGVHLTDAYNKRDFSLANDPHVDKMSSLRKTTIETPIKRQLRPGSSYAGKTNVNAYLRDPAASTFMEKRYSKGST